MGHGKTHNSVERSVEPLADPVDFKPLLSILGDIALQGDTAIKDNFTVEAKRLLADTATMRVDSDALHEAVLTNIRDGHGELIDRSGHLGPELDAFVASFGLDDDDAMLVKMAVVTGMSRLLERGTVPAPEIVDAGEPTDSELSASEEEYERLAHVPLSPDAQIDYMQKVGRYDLLSAAEEVELAKQIEIGLFAMDRLARDEAMLTPGEKRELKTLVRSGTRARDAMFSANLRLVVSFARRYSHRGMSMLDLIQEGNIGLLHSIEKFDYQKGFKFSTYASWLIKQSISRAQVEKSRLVRLPDHVHWKVNQVMQATSRVEAEIGREVTDDELAAALDMSPGQVAVLRQHSREHSSFNAPVGNDGAELGDMIADKAPTPDDIVLGALSDEEVRSRLDILDGESQMILRLRFGIGDNQPRTLDEVAEIMDMERVAIRRIESRAMKALREAGR